MAAGNTPAGQKRRQGVKVLGFAADRADRLAVANYYAYRYNGFDMKFHAHPNAEIMYNDGGACEIFWKENGNNKKLALKKGQFAVLPSQTQHMLYVPQGCRCDILNLELTLSAENGLPCAELEGAGLEFLGGGVRFAEDTANVGATIKKLHEELGSAQFNAGSGLQIAALLAQLLVMIARVAHMGGSDGSYIINKAMKFIDNEYANGISSKDVAESMKLHPVYLERQFKKHTGVSMLSHINTLRVERAKQLILNTALPLIDVGAECGFNTRQNFYETFKKYEGCSPSDYRRRKKERTDSSYRQAPYEAGE